MVRTADGCAFTAIGQVGPSPRHQALRRGTGRDLTDRPVRAVRAVQADAAVSPHGPQSPRPDFFE